MNPVLFPRFLFSGIVVIFWISGFSQFSMSGFSYNKEKALIYYNDAVKLYNDQHFKEADSLFSVSLSKYPEKDAYFARALARGKMTQRQGYCEDLIESAVRGEDKALKLYKNGCGSVDTVFEKLDQKETKRIILSRRVTFTLPDSSKRLMLSKYASQVATSPFKPYPDQPNNKDSSETNASFPGGLPEMGDFIRNNLKFPRGCCGFEGKRLVFLKFIIYEDGTLHNIEVLKGIEECPGCDEQAARVIALMPQWTPAYKNGHAVKSYFNLPISFRVN